MKRGRTAGGDEVGENTLTDDIANPREYRTVAKKRRSNARRNSESSASSVSASEDSGTESDSDGWSSWGSEEEGTTELPEEQAARNGVGHKLKKEFDKVDQEKEGSVIVELDNFWSSKVAPKARKELGLLKTYLSQEFSSSETLRQRFSVVDKLMGLPYVVSVGFSKGESQFVVTVSDKKKALELSEELGHPSVNLVEARSSHLL